jgi:hypothetical protein
LDWEATGTDMDCYLILSSDRTENYNKIKGIIITTNEKNIKIINVQQAKTTYMYNNKKVQQSLLRPEQALRIPGGLGSHI